MLPRLYKIDGGNTGLAGLLCHHRLVACTHLFRRLHHVMRTRRFDVKICHVSTTSTNILTITRVFVLNIETPITYSLSSSKIGTI